MISIEKLEDYGGDGVTYYSVIDNMEFYYAAVRASGITILTELDDDVEMENDHPRVQVLKQAVNNYIVEEMEGQNG